MFLALVGLSSARTDISGCISSQTTNQWHEASMIWYVPGSGEICDFIDCGGGRAPPKTDQPGCPLYTGTETVTPSYLPGYGPNGSKMAATTTTASETTASDVRTTTETDSSSSSSLSSSSKTVTNSGGGMITAAPTTSPAVSMTTTTSSASGSTNSTASAATSTQTGGAAFQASNVAGVMAVIVAVVGAISL